jgi:glycosyltransferase involved in cell wall biosynthesis
MSEHPVPRVSIGLPVYNGERYLPAALDSLLGQTYPDFELVISDNASTDRTEEICRAAAARDARVRYHRNERNIGGSPNHNRVVHLSRGELFVWGADDDLRAPTYLERCVPVLDARPNVVICFTRTQEIGAEGEPLPAQPYALRTEAERPSDRFRELIRMDHRLDPIYGVIRMSVLRTTPLEGQYADCDRVLLAEIGLHGPFHQIPEELFFRRRHPGQSIQVFPGRHQRTGWFDPEAKDPLVFPHFRQFREYLSSIRRAPISSAERRECFAAMAGWLAVNRSRLAVDLEWAGRWALRPAVRGLRRLGSGGP